MQVFNILRFGSIVGLLTPLGLQGLTVTMVQTLVHFPLLFVAIVLTEALALRRSLHFIASFAAIVASLALAMGFMLLLYGGTNVPLVVRWALLPG